METIKRPTVNKKVLIAKLKLSFEKAITKIEFCKTSACWEYFLFKTPTIKNSMESNTTKKFFSFMKTIRFRATKR